MAANAAIPGPYAQMGARLVEMGYAAIPIMPGTKRPGVPNADGTWLGLDDWQARFRARLPLEVEIDRWSDSDGGVCVVLGAPSRGVVSADIDTDDAAIRAALLGVLPETIVGKAGQKGETLFYRASDSFPSRAFNLPGPDGKPYRVLDLLGPGKQTVLPPTLHPDTGQPYRWTRPETLDGVSPEDLPWIDDDIGERIAEALKPFGYAAEPPRPPRREVPAGEEAPHRRLNNQAMADLGAWVPDLALYKIKRSGGGYRAVATWRASHGGRPLEKRSPNLKIHPDGIRDFHDGDRAYTPLDLVMCARDVDLDQAFEWLAERVGFGDEVTIDLQPHQIKKLRQIEFQDGVWIDGATGEVVDGPATTEGVPGASSAPEIDFARWRSSEFIGDPPPVEWLIHGSIPIGIPGMVAAQGDVGKSMLLLDAGRRIAFGIRPMNEMILGGHVEREGTVVILTAEDSANAVHRRLASVDPKGARFSERGERLIVVPLPDENGPIPLVSEKRGQLQVTDHYKRLFDQLHGIPDLAMVVFDPLQAFVQAKINEDPAAGQFVCSQLARLASGTQASVIVAHHMKKADSKRPITSLGDAREAVRGTSAIIDGLRLAYALWPAEVEAGKRICQELKVPFEPNKIVFGGVIKANEQARRQIATYVRNEFGLLVDRSHELLKSAPVQDDPLDDLVDAVAAAAAKGLPFTKSGINGLFEQRARLPAGLQNLGRNRLQDLAQRALNEGRIVQARAIGSRSVNWLDVPTGNFAMGFGVFTVGAAT